MLVCERPSTAGGCFVVLCFCACAFIFAFPAAGKAAESSASIGGGCWIEPWYCESEGPECLVKPWECESEESKCVPWECEEGGKLQLCDGELCSYIIVFWDWVEDPAAAAHEQVEKYDGKLGSVYKYVLNGYSAGYRPSVVDEVACEPTVEYVNEDRTLTIAGTPSSGQSSSSDGVIECDGGEPKPECTAEPSDCGGEEPMEVVPEVLLGPASPIEGNGAGNASPDPGPGASGIKRCGKGRVHRYGRCVRGRAVVRRACRKRSGSVHRRCTLRTMHTAHDAHAAPY